MNPLYVYIICIILLAVIAAGVVWACLLYKATLNMNPELVRKAELLESLRIANEELKERKEEIKNCESALSEARDNIEQGKRERAFLDAHAAEIAAARLSIDNAKAELENLNKNVDKRQNQLQDLQQSIQEEEQRKQQLLVENARVQSENAQLDAIKEDIRQKEQKRETIQNAINSIQQEYVRYKDCVEKLEETKRQLSALEVNVEQKKAEVQNLNQKKEELQHIEGKLKTTGKELESLTKEVKEKRDILEKLKDDISKKESQITEYHSKISQIESLTQKLHKLEPEVESYEKKARSIEVEKREAEQCWEDLERKVPNLIVNKRKIEEESGWLDAFMSRLDQCHITFPKRVIRAFHTGLKVADASPLVVLAGISGTGKSLLPELYARAIGMNFMQVAVQPRWDSPQDMLGFYNYMETRFKATELSRLLWQTDRYNNPALKGENPVMNLVLLDEMNLARVEYYFSDFLSKLEVRRGIDANNIGQRRPAEIILECGATQFAEATRSIYVGPNTLFVGTMNEDESTQSLSDKVMDRSNMIRFGRPSSLDVKPDKDRFVKACVDKGIDVTEWNKWMQRDNREFEKKALDAIDDLNKSLAKVGRPFAHRTWQSIRAYIKQYPMDGLQGYHHALSDQIEMKILPKLVGLDKQDSAVEQVLSEIRNKISGLELNDDALDEALELAFDKNVSNAIFQWRGVVRK